MVSRLKVIFHHLTNKDYPVMKDIYDLIEFEITKLDMKKKRGENVSTVEYNDYVQLRGSDERYSCWWR